MDAIDEFFDKNKIPDNGLGFVLEQIGPNKLPFLAYKGEKLPGQTSVKVSEPDMWGTRIVHVIFEVQADMPAEAGPHIIGADEEESE